MTNSSNTCTCNRCGATANSIHGTKHRRCSGYEAVKTLRPKHAAKATIRGTWEAKWPC